MDVIISDEATYERLIKEFTSGGKEKIHVVADFDRTLTKAIVNGKSTPSVLSELRNGDYISKEYAKKAQALADKYHPIEIDVNLPIEEKKVAMQEWWSRHFNLLIESGLNRKHLQQIVDMGKIEFRKGALEFFDLLNKNNIPLVIISSSGLGDDSIRMFFEREGKSYPNLNIVSNVYIWDNEGNALCVKEPIIHVMNKDETALEDYPFFNVVKDRKNVILLGDSLGDLGMIKGFNYDFLIKVGFLNDRIEENLESYKKNFDVVITNDGTMDFLNKMIEKILK